MSEIAEASGGGGAGSGAFGNAGLGDARADASGSAGRRRNQKPDAGKGRADQARRGRNAASRCAFPGAAEEIAARRRGAHRDRAVHVALCGCRRRQIEARASALIMHDLFPDVLVMAGLLKPASIPARAMRAANALMFRALDAVVIIGRDTERLLSRYTGITPRQDPVYSELGDAGARCSADPTRQPLSPRTRRPLCGRPVRQSRLYP